MAAVKTKSKPKPAAAQGDAQAPPRRAFPDRGAPSRLSSGGGGIGAVGIGGGGGATTVARGGGGGIGGGGARTPFALSAPFGGLCEEDEGKTRFPSSFQRLSLSLSLSSFREHSRESGSIWVVARAFSNNAARTASLRTSPSSISSAWT